MKTNLHTHQPIFHRPEVAKRYIEYLLHQKAAESGTFLAAPRRTGKSTFLREDLKPALEKLGIHVIYVDLWEDLHELPENALIKAIQKKIESEKGIKASLRDMVKCLRLSAGFANVSLDLETTRKEKSVTVAQVLDEYTSERNSLVVIVDEAQQLLTTEEGKAMMFALKAARDLINMSENPNKMIRLIFTGSDRERLASLRNHKASAFFGSAMVRDMPLLGKDFIQWFCEAMAKPIKLNVDEVMTVFEEAGHRPEFLTMALGSVSLEFDTDDEARAERFFELVRADIQSEADALFDEVNALAPLNLAILAVLAKNPGIAPFSQDAYQAYQSILNDKLMEEDVKVSSSTVQASLSLLRAKDMIWRMDRGRYEVEKPEIFAALEDWGLLDADTAHLCRKRLNT